MTGALSLTLTDKNQTRVSFFLHYQSAFCAYIYIHLMIYCTIHSHTQHRGKLLLDVIAHISAPTPFSHGAIAVNITIPLLLSHWQLSVHFSSATCLYQRLYAVCLLELTELSLLALLSPDQKKIGSWSIF